MTTPTQALSDLGVSIWLDDLSRDRLNSGNLQELIDQKNVVGVTTNPTIFQQALSHGQSYQAAMEPLRARGLSSEDAVFELMAADVRDACDVFRPVYDQTDGVDGRVSIEVSPELARDTQRTIAQADHLHRLVGRDNVLIKIPATAEGLPAITETLARGISVNVTLIFSVQRYREVVDAYFDGIEEALRRGHDISTIHSVASFFVSRVDTAVDQVLDRNGSPEALALRSQAGVANARLAYQEFERLFQTDRATGLIERGMRVQRPLWASTGVKDPALPDTLYVTELAVAHTVNTMPEKTLLATADHGVISGDRVRGFYGDAKDVLDQLARFGVSYDQVTQTLEEEGVTKFVDSWRDLLHTVSEALK